MAASQVEHWTLQLVELLNHIPSFIVCCSMHDRRHARTGSWQRRSSPMFIYFLESRLIMNVSVRVCGLVVLCNILSCVCSEDCAVEYQSDMFLCVCVVFQGFKIRSENHLVTQSQSRLKFADKLRFLFLFRIQPSGWKSPACHASFLVSNSFVTSCSRPGVSILFWIWFHIRHLPPYMSVIMFMCFTCL